MFGGTWVGGAPVGWIASGKLVTFAADASVAPTCQTVTLSARRGYASTASAGATAATLPIIKIRRLASSRAVGVTASAQPGFIFRLRSEVAVFATAFLGASTPREFASAVTCGAAAELLPFDALFDAAVSVGATTEATMRRTRQLAGTAFAGAVADPVAGFYRTRRFTAAAFPSATSAADPDAIRGGVRFAEFSCATSVSAVAEEDSIASVFFGAMASCGASALPVNAIQVSRLRQLIGGTHLVQAVASAADMRVLTRFAGAGSISLTTWARLGRIVTLAAQAIAQASVVAPRLALTPARFGAATSVNVSGEAAANIRRALAGMAYPAVTGVATEVRLAWKFASAVTAGATATTTEAAGANVARHFTAGGQVNVTADPASYFTVRQFGAEATVAATANAEVLARLRALASEVSVLAAAVAELRTNLFDDEPEYRTDFVEPADFVDQVEPQDFVLTVTDDGASMKTFTKQPGEKLPYDIDFSEWFANLEGDDIESAEAVVASASLGEVGDLTIEQPIKIGDPCYRVKVWTEDGIDGATYKITVTVHTEGGRRKERDFKLKVKEA